MRRCGSGQSGLSSHELFTSLRLRRIRWSCKQSIPIRSLQRQTSTLATSATLTSRTGGQSSPENTWRSLLRRRGCARMCSDHSPAMAKTRRLTIRSRRLSSVAAIVKIHLLSGETERRPATLCTLATWLGALMRRSSKTTASHSTLAQGMPPAFGSWARWWPKQKATSQSSNF